MVAIDKQPPPAEGAQGSIDHEAFREVYDLGGILGTGGFGEVRFAVHRETGEQVAVKIIKIPEGKRGHKMLGLVKQEISILQKVSHRNLMRLREVYRLRATFYLVTEYCRGGELLESLMANTYSEDEAVKVMWGLAKGVGYLHSKGIVHRDLKLENILLESSKSRTRVKIADFGLAAEVSTVRLNSVSGSMLYVAPEILACSHVPDSEYDQRVDIWSIGVALYILLSGTAPFDDPDSEVMLGRIMRGEFTFAPPPFRNVSEDAKDLIRRCLAVDPGERIEIREILAHPWMAGAGKWRMWDSGEDSESLLLEGGGRGGRLRQVNAATGAPPRPATAAAKSKKNKQPPAPAPSPGPGPLQVHVPAPTTPDRPSRSIIRRPSRPSSSSSSSLSSLSWPSTSPRSPGSVPLGTRAGYGDGSSSGGMEDGGGAGALKGFGRVPPPMPVALPGGGHKADPPPACDTWRGGQGGRAPPRRRTSSTTPQQLSPLRHCEVAVGGGR